MSQDLAEQFGVPFYHSKVGEANVTALMIEKQAVFGGEGNGGPIDPRVGYVRDSFVGHGPGPGCHGENGGNASVRLAAELPQYAIHKTKVPVAPHEIAARLDRLEQSFCRRHRQPPRRPAAGLARSLVAGARQQHRTDCAVDRRGPAGDEAERLCAPPPGAGGRLNAEDAERRRAREDAARWKS